MIKNDLKWKFEKTGRKSHSCSIESEYKTTLVKSKTARNKEDLLFRFCEKAHASIDHINFEKKSGMGMSQKVF